jgi:hypothetical protein
MKPVHRRQNDGRAGTRSVAEPGGAGAANPSGRLLTGAARPLPFQRIRSGLAYLALVAGLMPASAQWESLGAPLVLAAILAGWRDLRRVSRVLMLLVGLAGTSALLWAPQALADAAGNTARLTALVIAVMLLSATLGRSRDLAVLSGSLFAGRPLPRYLGVTFATGFFAVPLNFGAVGVMSAMIQQVIERRGDSALTRNAARAVLRGFALASFCSPLSISVVITLTFLRHLPLWQLIALSGPLAIGYLLLGAAFREPEGTRPVDAAALPDGEAAAASLLSRELFRFLPWLRFAAYIGAICVGALALSGWGDMPYSRAVALSCVVAVAVGLLFRRLQGEPVEVPSMAPISNELAIMSGSAFLGVLAGSAGLQLLGLGFSLPAWAYPVTAFLVPWLLFLGGLSGLNPIVTGTLAGALLGPIWPQPALLGLGIGMVSGWGLTAAGTPYTANSLLLSRITGYDARTVAMRWNLRLSFCALLLSGLLAAGLTLGLAVDR